MLHTCKGCGIAVVQLRRSGRRRKWCSDKCRKYHSYVRFCVDCRTRLGASDGNGPKASVRCVPCAQAKMKAEAFWTPEAIVGAIQAWADEHGGIPPSARDWLRPLGGVFPTVSHVLHVCGSWNAAIAAAGFSARPRGKYGRDGEDDLLCREIRERYEAGASTPLLAAEYGCGCGAIVYRVRKAGGVLRGPREAQLVRYARGVA